ncbi:MAG: agmatine deiminase family protein [Coprobacter sp.]|nr:agmatine deiminase family protein [Coprobacter sp.]
MNVESILGITSSLIAIGGAVYGGYKLLKSQSADSLLKSLADRHTPIKKQKRILHKINTRLVTNNVHISKEYISNFIAGGRTRSAIFHDICIQNNIEPTVEICIKMLGYDDKIFRKQWENDYARPAADTSVAKSEDFTAPAASRQEEELNQKSSGNPMSHRKQIVYVSELLHEKFPHACENLTGVLDKHGITYRFLKGTHDIWCRDYMPVQTASGKLVQFRYDPSYLKGVKEYEESRSDVREVCTANNIKPVFSDINLDGGNVLVCGSRAIISDRVFAENPEKDAEELKSELSELLEAEIIVIPTIKGDYTGHADGMVRFVDADTILGNNRADEYKYWRDGINRVLAGAGLRYIDVPFFYDYKDKLHPEHAIGLYVNYLEVENLIVMPKFGVPGNKDDEAFAKIKEIFPDRVVETIDFNDVALEGGVLNCATWTVWE